MAAIFSWPQCVNTQSAMKFVEMASAILNYMSWGDQKEIRNLSRGDQKEIRNHDSYRTLLTL